jgi:hypothetical protein
MRCQDAFDVALSIVAEIAQTEIFAVERGVWQTRRDVFTDATHVAPHQP